MGLAWIGDWLGLKIGLDCGLGIGDWGLGIVDWRLGWIGAWIGAWIGDYWRLDVIGLGGIENCIWIEDGIENWRLWIVDWGCEKTLVLLYKNTKTNIL